MRLVVDTNVFVSAALKESSWPAVVVRWLRRHEGLLKTTATESELFEVLKRPRIADDVLPLFAENIGPIFAAAELINITERITALS